MSDLLISIGNILDTWILHHPYCLLSKLTAIEVETVFSNEELSNATNYGNI